MLVLKDLKQTFRNLNDFFGITDDEFITLINDEDFIEEYVNKPFKNNVSVGSDHFQYGLPRSEETKNKISEALLGKRKSEIHCNNIGLSKLGNTYVVGQKRTDKQKQNMSESKLGSKNSAFNKKQSEETKKRRADSLKQNPDKKNNKGGKWYNDGSTNTFIKVKDLELIGDINPFLIPGRLISLEQKMKMIKIRNENRNLDNKV